ncbi:MAG: hypothetical protein ACREJD_12615 [Phycisphaerales bacterium]
MKFGKMIVCGIAASVFSAGVLAQDQQNQKQPPAQGQRGGGPRDGGGGPGGMGGRQLSPERAKAAWNLQATGVAGRLGLKADQTSALVAAYTAARESQGTASDKMREEAMNKAREEGAGPETMRDMMKKGEELTTSEREKLQAALTKAIGADATAKAMPSLGLFSRQWDNVVDVFSTFKLETANQQTGLNSIEDFAVSSAAAQAKMRAARSNDGGQAGGAPPDREAMRTAAQEGRQKLLDSMQKILNKEQLTKLEESLGAGGRGGPGGGGGRRQGGGN